MELTLKDISEFIIDCEHKTAPIQEFGYPSIRTPNIGKGILILENVNRVSEVTYKDWTKRGEPQEGDLIIAREAPVGNVAIVPKNLKVCLGQRTVLVRPSKATVYPQYLCYLLLGEKLQGQILTQTTGATVAHLNMKDIRELKIPKLPTLLNQRKIASTLSAYDELIENNNQRIKLLEEMAEEIYKEWFVRMRFPGYESTKFFNEEGKVVAHDTVGALPEGWVKAKLRDCFANYIGGGWGEESPNGKNSVPAYVIRGTDIPNSRIGNLNFDVLRYHSVSNLSSRILQVNDIIFEVSGGTESQSLGRTVLITQSVINRFNHDIICASFCKSIRVKKELISPLFIYLLLNRLYLTGEIMLFQVQSTGISNYKFEDFITRQRIQIPAMVVQKAFDKIIQPMIDEIQILGSKNQLLQQTRDLLLPRLISGKLSVEHLVEEEEILSMAAEPQASYRVQKRKG